MELFSNLKEARLKKEENERIKRKLERKKIAANARLKKERFISLHPMVKRVIVSLKEALGLRGKFYVEKTNFREKGDLAVTWGLKTESFSNGTKEIFSISSEGEGFSITSHVSGLVHRKVKNQTEESLVKGIERTFNYYFA